MVAGQFEAKYISDSVNAKQAKNLIYMHHLKSFGTSTIFWEEHNQSRVPNFWPIYTS